jgi:hypothetical protein
MGPMTIVNSRSRMRFGPRCAGITRRVGRERGQGGTIRMFTNGPTKLYSVQAQSLPGDPVPPGDVLGGPDGTMGVGIQAGLPGAGRVAPGHR